MVVDESTTLDPAVMELFGSAKLPHGGARRRGGGDCPPADSAALADGLISVLEDGQLRERMVAAARLRVEQYAWPRLAQRLVRLYESLGAGDHSRIDGA